MKKIIVVMMLFPVLVLAISSVQVWKINGKDIEFHVSRDEGLLIESRCYKNKSCDSSKNFALADSKYYRNNYQAGVEPGVIICHSQFKGDVIIGKSFMGENAFCRFKDGSLIATGSLFRAVPKK